MLTVRQTVVRDHYTNNPNWLRDHELNVVSTAYETVGLPAPSTREIFLGTVYYPKVIIICCECLI